MSSVTGRAPARGRAPLPQFSDADALLEARWRRDEPAYEPPLYWTRHARARKRERGGHGKVQRLRVIRSAIVTVIEESRAKRDRRERRARAARDRQATRATAQALQAHIRRAAALHTRADGQWARARAGARRRARRAAARAAAAEERRLLRRETVSLRAARKAARVVLRERTAERDARKAALRALQARGRCARSSGDAQQGSCAACRACAAWNAADARLAAPAQARRACPCGWSSRTVQGIVDHTRDRHGVGVKWDAPRQAYCTECRPR